MKKTLHLLLFSLPILTYGQAGFDNFESYNLGLFDAQWDTTLWQSGNFDNGIWTSTSSMIDISGDYTFSGSQSLKFVPPIVTNEDHGIIRKLPSLNTDILNISMKAYIIWNIKMALGHDLHTPNLVAGFEADIGGQPGQNRIKTYANGVYTPIHTNTVSKNEWSDIHFTINYAIDSAYFYYNDTLVTSWQISMDATGQANAISYFNNIYIYATSGSSAYIDDIRIEQYSVSAKEKEVPLNSFIAYPNPTSGQIHLQLDLKSPTDVQYQILDIQGRTIHQWADKQVLTAEYSKDLSDLPKGMYFVQVIMDGHIETRKVIVTN